MAAASESRDMQKLAEGWLYQLSSKEVKKKGFQQTSESWSSKYFVLRRIKESVHLDLYKKPPKKDEPGKDSLHLASYQVNKKSGANRHKEFVCEVLVTDVPWYYAFDTEERRDSFVFFLQTQKRLQDDITGTTFSVRPDDTPEQRKIGARGSVCFLHVCTAGLTLALQVSRSIVAQWPLKCIRWYASSERGQFVFEAGRRAPMGEGRYTFTTHQSHDTQLYDLLDKYVMDANSLWQAVSSDEFIEKKIFEDYCSLRLLALGFADMVFSRHLVRLSSTNFEHSSGPGSSLPPPNMTGADNPTALVAETATADAKDADTETDTAALSMAIAPAAAAAGFQEAKSPSTQNATNSKKALSATVLRGRRAQPGESIPKGNYMDMSSVRESANGGDDSEEPSSLESSLDRWCTLSSEDDAMSPSKASPTRRRYVQTPTADMHMPVLFAVSRPVDMPPQPADLPKYVAPTPPSSVSDNNSEYLAPTPPALETSLTFASDLRVSAFTQASYENTSASEYRRHSPAVSAFPLGSLLSSPPRDRVPAAGSSTALLQHSHQATFVPRRHLDPPHSSTDRTVGTSEYLYEPSTIDEPTRAAIEPYLTTVTAADTYEEVSDVQQPPPPVPEAPRPHAATGVLLPASSDSDKTPRATIAGELRHKLPLLKIFSRKTASDAMTQQLESKVIKEAVNLGGISDSSDVHRASGGKGSVQ